MIVKLILYFKGYIKIHASGYFLERFLNLCLKENILLQELCRISHTELTAKISIPSFKRLRYAARKTRTKIKIRARFGFPFFVERNRKRRGVLLGLILFLLISWYCSTHIMGITFTGNNKIPDKDLLKSLASYGVSLGTPTDDIDTKILKNQMMTSLDDLAWLGVNLKGSRLYLEIREREERKDIPGDDEPCNLVASKNGVVRLMEIRDGQTMVLVNTLVKKGDLLVSGVIDSNAVGMRYTHSYGEVYASTWYKEEIEIPLKYKSKAITSNKKSKIMLEFFGISLPLYIKENPDFTHFISTKSTIKYSPFIDIFPPLIIKNNQFFQQTEQNKERTVSEAVTLGKFYLLHRVNSQLSPGAKFENIKFSHKKSGDVITVTLECDCYENIAIKTPIDKTEDLEYNSNNSDLQTR